LQRTNVRVDNNNELPSRKTKRDQHLKCTKHLYIYSMTFRLGSVAHDLHRSNVRTIVFEDSVRSTEYSDDFSDIFGFIKTKKSKTCETRIGFLIIQLLKYTNIDAY